MSNNIARDQETAASPVHLWDDDSEETLEIIAEDDNSISSGGGGGGGGFHPQQAPQFIRSSSGPRGRDTRASTSRAG